MSAPGTVIEKSRIEELEDEVVHLVCCDDTYSLCGIFVDGPIVDDWIDGTCPVCLELRCEECGQLGKDWGLT